MQKKGYLESLCYCVNVRLFYFSATMFKIIKEMLPPDVRVARDAQDLLVECCVGKNARIIFQFHVFASTNAWTNTHKSQLTHSWYFFILMKFHSYWVIIKCGYMHDVIPSLFLVWYIHILALVVHYWQYHIEKTQCTKSKLLFFPGWSTFVLLYIKETIPWHMGIIFYSLIFSSQACTRSLDFWDLLLIIC